MKVIESKKRVKTEAVAKDISRKYMA